MECLCIWIHQEIKRFFYFGFFSYYLALFYFIFFIPFYWGHQLRERESQKIDKTKALETSTEWKWHCFQFPWIILRLSGIKVETKNCLFSKCTEMKRNNFHWKWLDLRQMYFNQRNGYSMFPETRNEFKEKSICFPGLSGCQPTLSHSIFISFWSKKWMRRRI